jgi:hypothetical protein
LQHPGVERANAMPEQPSSGIATDVLVILISLVIIGIGIWGIGL